MPVRSAGMIAVAVLAGFLGCTAGGPDGRAEPERNDVTAEMRNPRSCVNSAEGYVVEYPANWHVNTEEIVGPCSLFDSEPILVPIASELPLEIAITIGFEAGPLALFTGTVLGRRNLSVEDVTVNGRRAVRIEGETTGEGLHDRGIRSYQYFVDLGDTTMIAGTYAVGAVPFDRKRRILDEMMSSFDFQAPESAGP